MSATPKNSLFPLIVIAVLFAIFGFITWVNGTLIAFFKDSFQLTDTKAYLVTMAFFISYTIMAIPSSMVLQKTGFKNGMSLGLGIMAVGTLLFIPAASMVSYELFLVGLFTIGIGLTLLQTASNPYVTLLGPPESAATRISIMGVANKLAGIASQLIIGGILFSKTTENIAATPEASLSKVIQPYMIITIVLVILAFVIWRMKGLPEPNEEEANDSHATPSQRGIFTHANLVLGVIAIFCYVGAEVIAGDTIISYGKAVGYEEEVAKVFGTYTLWAMLLGYFLGIILIPKFVSQQKWLTWSALLGILLTIATIFLPARDSVYAIAALGLANAIMWPAIWPLALKDLGMHTKLGSAFLIMGIAGGAILPLVYGMLSDNPGIGNQKAYLLLAPLYLFILYFSTSGHKKLQW